MKQWPALDIAKCFAMVAVLLSHTALYFASTNKGVSLDQSNPLASFLPYFLFLTWFVFFMPIAAGSTLFFLTKTKTWRQVLVEAVFIYILGNIINTVTWGIDFFWSWNILQFIAVSYIIIYALYALTKHYGVYILGMLSLGLQFFPVPKDITIAGFAIIFGSNNYMYYWPFYPWFFMTVFGYGVAHFFQSDTNHKAKTTITAGLGLVALSFLVGNPYPHINADNIWDLTLFQPQASLLVFTAGLYLLVLGTGSGIKILRKYGFVSSISKGSLWIYAISLPVTYHIGQFVTKYGAILGFFIFSVAILLASWFIGYLSIRIIHDKSIVIRLKKGSTRH